MIEFSVIGKTAGLRSDTVLKMYFDGRCALRVRDLKNSASVLKVGESGIIDSESSGSCQNSSMSISISESDDMELLWLWKFKMGLGWIDLSWPGGSLFRDGRGESRMV